MKKRFKQLRFLKNKVVLITGGDSGIGKALALEAARRGAIVIVVARDQKRLEKVANQCLILSGRPAFSYQLDVTDPDQIDAVLSQIQHEVGGIDALVNSAGLGDFSPATGESFATLKRMTDVNLLALMYISRCVARQMMDQGMGQLSILVQWPEKFQHRIVRHTPLLKQESISLITSYEWKLLTMVCRF